MYVWGGRAWKRFVDLALQSMGDLHGKTVLEIGFHDGELSREFARRGATVTALEIRRDSWEKVRQAENVSFLHYSGDLDSIPGTYDYVFTKSVLVTTDLLQMIPAIKRKLKPSGRVVFIENGAGGLFVKLTRRLARPGKNLSHLDYFTGKHIEMINASFNVQVEYSAFPPVYFILSR